MSIVEVRQASKLRRRLRYVAIAVLAGSAVAVVAIQVQQHVLRYRAEQLLVDIRGLDLRTSTFADAQKIFQRWEEWGHYRGKCTERYCEFEVTLNDFQQRHAGAFAGRFWLLNVYSALGGRPAAISGRLTLIDGVVWGKSVWLMVHVRDGNSLIGDSHSVFRLSSGYSPTLSLHPHCLVHEPDACTYCKAVHARFTPYAAASDVRKLMDFNLGCLTRWEPCREQGDIMPAAWTEYMAERGKLEATWRSRYKCTLQEVPWHARDTENAALVEVLQNRREQRGSESFQVSTLRLVQRLKHSEFWELGTDRQARVSKESVISTKNNDPADLQAGDRLIILFYRSDRTGPNEPEVWLDECGAMPADQENLNLVQSGISQDFLAAHPGLEQVILE